VEDQYQSGIVGRVHGKQVSGPVQKWTLTSCRNGL